MNDKVKLSNRKLREKKVNALRELANELETDDYDKKRANIIKRTYKAKNKREREQGNIAEDMIDIAGVIKETGDPILTKLQNIRTKYKTKDDAEIAGVKFKAKGGEVKKYMGGGSVNKNKKNKMATTKGWGASRKT